MRCAVVVITRAATRMAARTGAGRVTPRLGGTRMRRFVVLHAGDHRPRPDILGRQPFEVAFKVALHLPLGLGHEAQTETVTGPRGQHPQPEGPGVPDRIQQRWPAAQFSDALAGPGKMIDLLLGCLLEGLAQDGIARAGSLTVIKRLGADLTHMVDPHERRSQRPLRRR